MYHMSLLSTHAVRFMNRVYRTGVWISVEEPYVNMMRTALIQHLLWVTVDTGCACIRPKTTDIVRYPSNAYLPLKIGLSEAVRVASYNALLPDLVRPRNRNILDTLLPFRLLNVFSGVFEIGALRCSLILDPEVFLLLCIPEVSWYWLAVHAGGALAVSAVVGVNVLKRYKMTYPSA